MAHEMNGDVGGCSGFARSIESSKKWRAPLHSQIKAVEGAVRRNLNRFGNQKRPHQ